MNNGIISLREIPSLDDFVVESVDLNSEYWTPDEAGETRRMFFMGIHNRSCPDHNDPEVQVELECAVFILPAKEPDGAPKTVTNASKRLVASFVNTGIASGTPVQITYRGKKRNRTNGNMSDDWAIQTLQPGGKK